MFKRARHQQGSLHCVKRKTGKTVWEFRWYEPTTNDGTVYRKKVIGTIEEYQTESQAQRAADALRLTINAEQTSKSVSISALVEHYRTEELSDENQRKAFSTKQAYKFLSQELDCAALGYFFIERRQTGRCRELAESGAAI